jgi:diguanylate cyclase
MRPTILVVEDNVATRALLESTLDLEGYEVRSLADGESVAAEIATRMPALVILDVMMPGMDGFAVLKQIRDNERTHELPVVMLTAMDDPDSTWKGWRTGCNYYMNKPFETDELLHVVADLVQGVAA